MVRSSIRRLNILKPTTLLENDSEAQEAIKEANATKKEEPCYFDEMRYVMIKNGMADPEEEEVQCPNCGEPIYKDDYPKIRFRKDSNDVHFYCPICGEEF
jgi:predicted RNA-binding Zn-ribbon protein involved in translation (DUF1610 family)